MTLFILSIYIFFLLFGLIMFSKIYIGRNKFENSALKHFCISILLAVVSIIAILLIREYNFAFLAYTCFYILFTCIMFYFYWFSITYCKREFVIYKSFVFYLTLIEIGLIISNYFTRFFFIILRGRFGQEYYWYAYSSKNYQHIFYLGWIVCTVGIIVNMLAEVRNSPKLYRPRYIYIILLTMFHSFYQNMGVKHDYPNWLGNIMLVPFGALMIYFSVYYSDMVFKQSALLYVAENLSDGFALFGEDNKRIYINDRLKFILTPEQDRNFIYKEKFDEWVNEATELNGIFVKKVIFDGMVYYFNVIPHIFTDKNAYVGTSYSLQDVTSTIERLELVEKANNELIKADHMKSDFLANMSHEIRTPMNAVIGMAEMALREEMSEDAKNYINQIKSSGKVLLNIINDILDFSKIESGKFEIIPVDYNLVMQTQELANTLITRVGEKDIELTIDYNPNIPASLNGDCLRIRQVLVNIANNAIKFTEKGNVSIFFDYKIIDEDNISLEVRISDTGIGIKKEDIPKLFNSFQQVNTKRNRNIEGTGLGLAISKNLITTMGGNISVESEYGKGSTFSFNIPQKVVDWSPSFELKNTNKIFAFGLFNNKYLAKRFYSDTHKFNIFSAVLKSSGDFEYTTETYADVLYASIPYIFFEENQYDDSLEQIFIDNPEYTGVVIAEYGSFFKTDLPNIKVFRKPYITNIITMALNDEDLAVNYNNDSNTNFIAPTANILVVDDNDINITIVEGLLQPLNMNIMSARSGKSAIDLLKNNSYDIVFMDHMMPGMDGAEATRIIRQTMPEHNDMPIIALTANAISGAKEFFLSIGMNDFVPKPIEIRDIISKVKKWLPDDKIQYINDYLEDEIDASETETNKQNANIYELPGIDAYKAVELLGTEKVYRTILQSYYDAINNNIDNLNMYFEEKNYQEYTIAVHALKSSSRQIGAFDLGEFAFSLEMAGKEGNFELIDSNHEMLISMYKEIQQILKGVVKSNSFDAISSNYIVDNKEIITMLENLIEANNDLDMTKVEEYIQELNNIRIPESIVEQYISLKNAVNFMDVDAIEEIAKDIIKCLT